MGEHASQAVEHIDLGITSELDHAAQQLVHKKFLIDAAYVREGMSELVSDLHGGGLGPHVGLDFLHKVLPFFGQLDGDEYFLGLVPVANTLGCSWQWGMTDTGIDSIEKAISEVTDVEALLSGTIDPASFAWVKPLGIIAPMEGKNRCDFLRRKGIESIPASITIQSYPDAERMTIYKVRYNAFEACWAVLDGRWLQRVEHPEWALPLLEAYGVRVESTWPAAYPNEKAVTMAWFEMHGLHSPLGDNAHSPTKQIDLEVIRAQAEFDSEELTATLSEVKNVFVSPAYWLIAIGCVLLGAVLIAFTPAAWTDFRMIVCLMIGAVVGAATFPVLGKIIVTERRFVKDQLPFPPAMLEPAASRPGKRYLG